jgi:ribosomal-protein-alanine N-acetyltransferase
MCWHMAGEMCDLDLLSSHEIKLKYLMDSKTAVILESERLLFRQHVLADLDAFCAMEKDPDVRRYVGGKPRTQEEAEHRFMNGAMKPVSDRLAIWATVLKSDGNYIGRYGIYPHFKPDGTTIPGEASLGLYIATAYWGRGYATEAGKAFIRFGFDELKLNRIATSIQVGNDASVHIIKKLGFELVWTETGGTREFLHYSLQNPLQKRERPQ